MDAEKWADDHALEVAKLQKDLLWNEYIELRTHARHAETVRTNAINFVILLTTVLVAVITVDKLVNRADLAAAAIVAVLGFLSVPFSVLFLERYERNKKRSAAIRVELDRLFFTDKGLATSLGDLRKASDAVHTQTSSTRIMPLIAKGTNKVRGTHFFWILVPCFVTLTGVVLTTLALTA